MSIEFTIGVDPKTELSSIAKVGVKTVYCGYSNEILNKKYPLPFCTVNGRGEDASFEDKESFIKFAENAKKNNISINVTFNVPYMKEQYKDILDAVNFVSQFESVKGIIVSDIGLLLRLKQINYKKNIIISVISNIFNSSVIKYYECFGANEFIFPKQIKIQEIISILNNNPNTKFEVFLLFGNCLCIEGFCSFGHCAEKKRTEMFNPNHRSSNCGILIESVINNSYEKENGNINKVSQKEILDVITHGCNLCYINKLKNYSDRITYKIISRGMNFLDNMPSYIKLIKSLENGTDIDSKNVYKKIFGTECNENGCYISDNIS